MNFRFFLAVKYFDKLLLYIVNDPRMSACRRNSNTRTNVAELTLIVLYYKTYTYAHMCINKIIARYNLP